MGKEDKIWWEQTNAKNYIESIVKKLYDETSIIIKNHPDIPWYSHFAMNIETQLKSVGHKSLEKIESGNIHDIGKYFLEKFCRPEIRNQYRPAKGYSAFLAENDSITLHDRFIWVNSVEKENLNSWMDFICEYVKKRGDRNKAVFILETKAEKIEHRKNISPISLEDFINDYDYVVFAILAASPIKEGLDLKTYLVELISNIVGKDAELSSECIEQYGDFLINPLKTIEKIVQKSRSNGTPFQFSKTDDEIEQAVWTAQIRTFYPLLEEYRRDFIKKYYNDIKEHLPTTTVFNETINTPEEIELGSLYYLKSDAYYEKTKKRLEVRKEDSYELDIFRNARHDLSHLHKLEFQRIQKLMETSFVKNRAKI